MKAITLRYGLYAGLSLIILGVMNWLLIANQMSYTASEVVGYLSMILALLFVYFGMRQYRDTEKSGQLSFGEGFKIGMLITLVPSILMFLWSVLFFEIWGDDFKVWAEEHFQSTMAAEEYAAHQQQMEEMGALYESSLFQGLVMFLTVLIIGFILTIISALILKRPDKAGEALAD